MSCATTPKFDDVGYSHSCRTGADFSKYLPLLKVARAIHIAVPLPVRCTGQVLQWTETAKCGHRLTPSCSVVEAAAAVRAEDMTSVQAILLHLYLVMDQQISLLLS